MHSSGAEEDALQTGIIACKACGYHTRQVREQWETFSLRSWLMLGGGTKRVEGWKCTKCGARRAVKTLQVSMREK
jgi:DNA-directed RNA polymerase subunit RPC12/RpoP